MTVPGLNPLVVDTLPLLQGIHSLHPNELSLTRELAFAFFEESELPGQFNWHHWRNSWGDLIEKKIGMIFVYFKNGAPVGVIGGITFLCLNTSDPEILEAFWYVLPEHRTGTKGIRLLERFEQWGRDIGAVRCKMVHLQDIEPEKMAEIYRRRGYILQEQCFRKELA